MGTRTGTCDVLSPEETQNVNTSRLTVFWALSTSIWLSPLEIYDQLAATHLLQAITLVWRRWDWEAGEAEFLQGAGPRPGRCTGP